MKVFLKRGLPVFVAAALMVVSNASAVPVPPTAPPTHNLLYDINPATNGGGAGNKGNWGFDFTTTQSFTVAALGFWDGGSDGVAASHTVGLFRTGDALLTSVIVDNSSTVIPSSNSSGRWLFTNLSAPLVLPAGAYTLSFYNPSGGDTFFSGMTTGFVTGASYNTAKGTNNAGSFGRPNTNSGNNGGWIGANLQFVPEPSSFVLAGMGAMAGLFVVARRKLGAISK